MVMFLANLDFHQDHPFVEQLLELSLRSTVPTKGSHRRRTVFKITPQSVNTVCCNCWDLVTFILKNMRKLAITKVTFSIIEHSIDGHVSYLLNFVKKIQILHWVKQIEASIITQPRFLSSQFCSPLGSSKFIGKLSPVTSEDEEIDSILESGSNGVNHVDAPI